MISVASYGFRNKEYQHVANTLRGEYGAGWPWSAGLELFAGKLTDTFDKVMLSGSNSGPVRRFDSST